MERKIPKFKNETQEREFWDSYSFLDFPQEIEEVETFSLAPELREDILAGKRKRPTVNVSLRFEPSHLETIKKLATMRSIPYQSLIRMWITEKLKTELYSHL